MPVLNWHQADSADHDHADEECDLVSYGVDASWGYVALNGGRWSWGVLDNWLWDEADYIAQGEESSKAEAQAAVSTWTERAIAKRDFDRRAEADYDR